MGLFDNLTNKVNQAVNSMGGGNKTVDVTFPYLPETLEQFKALPQANMTSPFDTAALTVLAFCYYPQNTHAKEENRRVVMGYRYCPYCRTEMKGIAIERVDAGRPLPKR